MEEKNKGIKVYAFVGPSGTGKSYRAQMVAGDNDIDFIIDDGLLVRGNNAIAGESAKKAPTKIETIKHAIFSEEKEKKEMIKAIKQYNVNSLLILGTSEGMVNKIAENLELPKIEKIVYIEEYASESEMETAKRIRKTEGKHVIPVPSFEIKKDFAGYILDPLQIFKTKGKGNKPYIAEKSIIRPTFSYLGNFTISDTVFKQIMEYLASKSEKIDRVIKTRVENTPEGPDIYMEIVVMYGFNVMDIVNEFKDKAIKEISKLTTMNVKRMSIIVKEIKFIEKNNIVFK